MYIAGITVDLPTFARYNVGCIPNTCDDQRHESARERSRERSLGCKLLPVKPRIYRFVAV
jgi:hypothetical protein